MKIATLLACTALVLGAMAVPVLAHDGDDQHDARHQDASDKAAERQEKADERRDAQQEKQDERRDSAKENRTAIHDEFKERRDEQKAARADQKDRFHAARDACKDSDNRSSCMKNATQDAKAARIGLHLDHHLSVFEFRLAKLGMMADRINATLESGELNETQEAHAYAMLERISAAQNKTLEHMEAKQARYDAWAAGDDAEQSESEESEAESEEQESEQEGESEEESESTQDDESTPPS